MFAFDAGSCDVAHLRKVPRANRPTTLTLQSFRQSFASFKTCRWLTKQIAAVKMA